MPNCPLPSSLSRSYSVVMSMQGLRRTGPMLGGDGGRGAAVVCPGGGSAWWRGGGGL